MQIKVATTKPPGQLHANKAGKHVYLVDDDVELLRFEAMLLETVNIDILTFENAEAALHAFKNANECKPVLIISDYQMGKMNGLQLLETAKRLAPELRTMLVSGAVVADILKHSPVKIDAFMAKPFQASEFLRQVKSLLGMPPAPKAGRRKP